MEKWAVQCEFKNENIEKSFADFVGGYRDIYSFMLEKNMDNLIHVDFSSLLYRKINSNRKQNLIDIITSSQFNVYYS